jgi:protein-disulfide isomerase
MNSLLRSVALFLLTVGPIGCPKSTQESTDPTSVAGAEPPAQPARVRPEVLKDLPGYPLKNMAGGARADFVRIVEEELCGCDSYRTLAGCLSKAEACNQAVVMAQIIQRRLEGGMDRATAQLDFSKTITNGHCGDPIDIDVSGFPHKGQEKAYPVIEFADFLCPHCAKARLEFDGLLKTDLPVQMVFIPVDPSGNPESRGAGLAFLAAARQGVGKAWALHDAMFGGQPDLSEARIRTMASAAGLDVTRLMADRKDPSLVALFERGTKLFAEVKAPGTPFVLINGRPLAVSVRLPDLVSRVHLELLRNSKECEQ